jgi:recombinational DNA repair protein (RecF pathway)
MLYQTEGIFLAQFDLGEHDRVATVLTRDEGLVKAVCEERPEAAEQAFGNNSALQQGDNRSVQGAHL